MHSAHRTTSSTDHQTVAAGHSGGVECGSGADEVVHQYIDIAVSDAQEASIAIVYSSVDRARIISQ